MINIRKRNSIILPIILLFLVFIVGYFGTPSILIIVFALLSIWFLLFSIEKLYILFIIVYLSNGLVPRESYIFGVLGIHQVVTIVTLIAILIRVKGNFKYKFIEENIKSANRIIIFIVVYTLFVSYKNVYFGLFNASLGSAFNKNINFIIMSLVLVLLPTRLFDRNSFYNYAVQNIVFFFSISALFAAYLGELGLYTALGSNDNLERSYGFIGNGDANTLSLAMVTGISYLLNRHRKGISDSNFILLMFLSIAAIGASGSRSGLILLLVIFALYIYYSGKILNFLKRFIVIGLFALISLPLIMTNIERMRGSSDEQAYQEGSTSNRVGKWIFYLNYFYEEPLTLLRGGDDQLELGWDKSYLVAHNFYIQIIYGAGIIMLIYYLFLLWRISRLKVSNNRSLMMILIPNILGLMFISDYGALLYFAIVLSALGERGTVTSNGQILKY